MWRGCLRGAMDFGSRMQLTWVHPLGRGWENKHPDLTSCLPSKLLLGLLSGQARPSPLTQSTLIDLLGQKPSGRRWRVELEERLEEVRHTLSPCLPGQSPVVGIHVTVNSYELVGFGLESHCGTSGNPLKCP